MASELMPTPEGPEARLRVKTWGRLGSMSALEVIVDNEVVAHLQHMGYTIEQSPTSIGKLKPVFGMHRVDQVHAEPR